MIRRIWARRRRGALEAISEHLDAQNALLREIRTELRRQRREITGKDRRRLEGILVNSLADGMRTELRCFARERMLGMRETLERLARENVGFARFGDGEFLLMLREPFSLRFQSNSHALQAALRDVFTRSTPDLMVGFPRPLQTLHWTNVWSDVWSEVKELVPESVVFGDSHVTRPIFFEMFREEGVDLWRRVWADKKVTVVAGEGGRFSLVDPLFDSASDIDIAWSVPVDAFEDLDRLVDELTRQRRDLYLLSLGPAATVLARRLADAGLRAIDIGHLSDSYRATFDGAELPEYRPVVTGDSEGTPNRRG